MSRTVVFSAYGGPEALRVVDYETRVDAMAGVLPASGHGQARPGLLSASARRGGWGQASSSPPRGAAG